MEKISKRKIKKIIDLIRWFEEFQPKDLEQIERILTGLKYVDSEFIESELRQDIYREIKSIKSRKNLEGSYRFIEMFFRKDINERMKEE